MATRTAAVTPERSLSTRPTSPRRSPPLAPPRPAAGLRLALAKTGDHIAIHGLLSAVFHGPSLADFQAQLDEPGYEASDRLVVRDGEQVAAHLRLARQTIQVGTQTLPAARFMDLATAEEYRGRGLATAMLAAGERAAAERGSLVALTRTRAPRLFARQGWSVCGRHSFSTAAPRAVLAELSIMSGIASSESRSVGPWRPEDQRVIVRPLRRIELPAIVRLYEQSLPGRCGWPVRSELYWEWLLARGACDRVYVAATEPESADLARLHESIVGYLFARQSRIVELVTTAGRDDVARHLLARVCADASEQDCWLVRCDLPPVHPLHAVLQAASGSVTSSREHAGEVFMAKLLDPLLVLRRLIDEFTARARNAKLPRPLELGIDLRSCSGGEFAGIIERYRLQIGQRRTQIVTGGPSRHFLTARCGDFASLVLGEAGADELAASGRLKASNKMASSLAAALFPNNGWWRPSLDDLLS
jgi:predicted acetyltransferase